MIEAVRILSERAVDIYLAAIGKQGKDVLKNYRNFADRVVFSGRLNLSPDSMAEDPLASALRRADVFVSSSVYEEAEGMSFAVPETMSCGLPIVATNIPGSREITSRYENGVSVEPKSAVCIAEGIVGTMLDSEVYQPMSNNSAKHASKLERSKIASWYLKPSEGISQRGVCG